MLLVPVQHDNDTYRLRLGVRCIKGQLHLNQEPLTVRMHIDPPQIPRVHELGRAHQLFPLPPELSALTTRFYTPWDVAADGRFIMARSLDRRGMDNAPLIVVENFFGEVKAKMGNE